MSVTPSIDPEYDARRERFVRIANIVLPFGAELKARMQKLGKRHVKVKCPQHGTPKDQGPYVTAMLAGRRDHLHMACEDADCCMRMMRPSPWQLGHSMETKRAIGYSIIRMASPSRLNVDPEVDHGPCHDCNGTGELWVEASYPECAEELAEYFADDPGSEPDPLNLETA